MTELQEAQFIRVIDRLVNDNKSLRDLVDFQTKENERLREALADIANIINPYEDGGTMQEIARAALEGKE
jgi:cell division protein FtsB